jgi:hypothetical protein
MMTMHAMACEFCGAGHREKRSGVCMCGHCGCAGRAHIIERALSVGRAVYLGNASAELLCEVCLNGALHIYGHGESRAALCAACAQHEVQEHLRVGLPARPATIPPEALEPGLEGGRGLDLVCDCPEKYRGTQKSAECRAERYGLHVDSGDWCGCACHGTRLAAGASGAGLGRETSNVGSPSGSPEIIGSSEPPEGVGRGSTPPGEDGGTRVERPEGARAQSSKPKRSVTLRKVLEQLARKRGRVELELQELWRARHRIGHDIAAQELVQTVADDFGYPGERHDIHCVLRILIAELDRLGRRRRCIERRLTRIEQRRRLARSMDALVSVMGGGDDA